MNGEIKNLIIVTEITSAMAKTAWLRLREIKEFAETRVGSPVGAEYTVELWPGWRAGYKLLAGEMQVVVIIEDSKRIGRFTTSDLTTLDTLSRFVTMAATQ